MRQILSRPLVLAGIAAAVAVTGYSAGARAANSPIAASDLLVFQAGDSTNVAATTSTPLYIQEINPTLSSQTSPVQSFAISTESSPLFTSSEGSDGDLALSDNGTLLTFAGWTSAAASGAENLVAGRGAGVLTAAGVYSQPITYTGSATAGNQTRAAFSQDGTNYYFGDKAGIYVNGGTSILTGSANTRSIKGFDGNSYALQASNGIAIISTITPATSSSGQTSLTFTGLNGLSAGDKNAVDFVLLSSGSAGAGVPDILYYTNGSAIVKYGLISGTWTAEGTDALASVSGITAVENSGGGATIYATVDGTSATLDSLVDSAAFNATISGSTPVVLYTAPAGDDLRGVSLAPVAAPEPASLGLLAVGAVFLAARRRK